MAENGQLDGQVGVDLGTTMVGAQQPRIMIVDDEPIVVKVLALYLRKGGYSDVVTTTESSTTVRMIHRCCPDVVLLDLNMPDVSGFDILAAILADDHLAGLHVVVVTAACDEKTTARAMSLGVKEILSKPVESSQLLSCIGNILK